MELYNAFNQLWINFLNIFPPEYRAFVSALIILAAAFSFYSLFMFNPAFSGIAFVIVMPILLPLIFNFANEVFKLLSDMLKNLPKPPVTPIMPK